MAAKNTRNIKNMKSEKVQVKTQNCFQSRLTGSGKVLAGLIIGMLLMLAAVIAFYPRQPQIAVVDINKIVNEYAKNIAEKKLSTEKMKQEVSEFGVKLEKELVTTSRKQDLVLLPSEAVLAGAKDLTNNMQKKLFSE